ncbi:MAG: hypothetical protein AB2A00_29200 [Myxococcota bacterium]
MRIQLQSLLGESFHTATETEDGQKILTEARERYVSRYGGIGHGVEVEVPAEPDSIWLTDVVRQIVTECETKGIVAPDWNGAFVSLHFRGKVHFIPAKLFVELACKMLGMKPQVAVARFSRGVPRPGEARPGA